MDFWFTFRRFKARLARHVDVPPFGAGHVVYSYAMPISAKLRGASVLEDIGEVFPAKTVWGIFDIYYPIVFQIPSQYLVGRCLGASKHLLTKYLED